MLYSQNRSEQRTFLSNAWLKYKNNEILNPIETQLAEIIKLHPEYQNLILKTNSEYFPEEGKTNPFLHINLHLALREQLSINQPKNMKAIFDSILSKIGDSHKVEHIMMECIAEVIHTAQINNQELNFIQYNNCLKEIFKEFK